MLTRSEDESSARSSEVQRHEGEIDLARAKNNWKSVAKHYGEIERIGEEQALARYHLHAAGAERELNGVTQRYVELLSRTTNSSNVTPDDAGWIAQAKASQEGTFENYGKVVVRPPTPLPSRGRQREEALAGLATITSAGMVFDPVGRRTIENAAKTYKEDGVFEGWLPLGDYTLGEYRFTVPKGHRQPTVVTLVPIEDEESAE